MSKKLKLILIVIILTILGAGIYSYYHFRVDKHVNETKNTLYTCGMHPDVIQTKPGICPICKMDLVPMKKQNKSDANSKVIKIDPVVVQNMGIRTAKVEIGEVFRNIRSIGEIIVAEDKISVVNLKFSGWVEKIYVDQTGRYVKKGSTLFDIYSPELVAAGEEYLTALNSADKMLINSAKEKLKYWDLKEAQIAGIVKNKKVKRTLKIKSPVSGYVLHKNVLEGAHVKAGMDLYKIGNLENIWVEAQVYEADALFVKKGNPATMELSFQKGKQYSGAVSYIYPTLNKESRTLTVRLEFKNPGLNLKPGMFATVWIKVDTKENILIIPKEAIIHTGERQIVFVSKGQGKFEAKEIVTGLVGDNNKVEIISGLSENEIIVTSGQFLLDSESNLREASAKFMEVHGH